VQHRFADPPDPQQDAYISTACTGRTAEFPAFGSETPLSPSLHAARVRGQVARRRIPGHHQALTFEADRRAAPRFAVQCLPYLAGRSYLRRGWQPL